MGADKQAKTQKSNEQKRKQETKKLSKEANK